MTKDKALKLILEWSNYEAHVLPKELHKAVEEALAQPAQEPVGDEWTPCLKLPVVVHVRQQRLGESHVSTREGITPVKPDDLIMRGVSGEEYPIGRAIFEQTYSFDTTMPQRQPLTNAEFVKFIEAAGFSTWDSKMWELKRQIETFYNIKENT